MDFMKSTPKQRKENMQKALDNTYCALMLYYDDDCNVKVCATAETGFEPQLLELLNTAAGIARNAVECSIVDKPTPTKKPREGHFSPPLAA